MEEGTHEVDMSLMFCGMFVEVSRKFLIQQFETSINISLTPLD